jgi:hypothetical protein
VTTLHDTAVYTTVPVPDAWYVAEMDDSPTGPRFDPRIVTTTPPPVGMAPRSDPAATDSDSIDGAAYDDTTPAPDCTPGTDATATVHRYPDPTPTTLTHFISKWATDTAHDVAV